MCDADTSRSFSSIDIYLRHGLCRDREHDENKGDYAAMKAARHSRSIFSPRTMPALRWIYVLRLASNCTCIIVLDRATQRRGRALDDSRRARRKKSRDDGLENVECATGRRRSDNRCL